MLQSFHMFVRWWCEFAAIVGSHSVGCGVDRVLSVHVTVADAWSALFPQRSPRFRTCREVQLFGCHNRYNPALSKRCLCWLQTCPISRVCRLSLCGCGAGAGAVAVAVTTCGQSRSFLCTRLDAMRLMGTAGVETGWVAVQCPHLRPWLGLFGLGSTVCCGRHCFFSQPPTGLWPGISVVRSASLKEEDTSELKLRRPARWSSVKIGSLPK